MPAIRETLLAALSTTVPLIAQAHWTLQYPTQSPAARNQSAMAYHAPSARLVLFGGRYNNTFFGDTWTFDGANWTQVSAVGPSAREGHAMAGDSTRGEVVLFGGSTGGGGPLQDTWVWNGSSWSQRSVAIHPSGRQGAAMAEDPERHRVVLFGGWDSVNYNDTWEWDGASWMQATVATAPPARGGTAMAFDPNLRQVLMYGGWASNQPIRYDTWSWNGTVWTWHQLGNPPPARTGHTMVSDTARRRVVMWGGSVWDGSTYEWDGTGWSAAFLWPPTPRAGQGMAYDPVHTRAVMFGGGDYGDTWIYGTDAPARFETIGQGCAGTAGTPALVNAAYSLPWIGDTFTTRVAPVPANGTLLFATGFEAPSPVSLGAYGMPGCNFAVIVAETRLTIATAGGSANWSLAIPHSTSLAGAEIAQQVLVLDPGANAAGAVVSSASRFTVGIR